MKPRFTRDGSAELEAKLECICQEVAASIQALLPTKMLEAIALGGGYGRGEGGVLRYGDGDSPYNDVEFFVFIRGPLLLRQAMWNKPLHQLAHALTEKHGIEIEFKLLTLDKLRRSAPSMFYYDLVMGHQWALGDDRMLAGCEHHRDATQIPLHEATRLLMNRSSGLLFAKERLSRADFSAEDADFVARNIAKAQLALGDVLLAAHGKYHWSCLERLKRLPKLPSTLVTELNLTAHHRHGVEFKLHPLRSTASREELQALHQTLTAAAKTLFLWLESRRLGTAFASPSAYAASRINKCPETKAARNRFINARQFGLGSLLDSRYPRQRLLDGLCRLLWGNDTPTFSTELRAYEQLWQRFN